MARCEPQLEIAVRYSKSLKLFLRFLKSIFLPQDSTISSKSSREFFWLISRSFSLARRSSWMCWLPLRFCRVEHRTESSEGLLTLWSQCRWHRSSSHKTSPMSLFFSLRFATIFFLLLLAALKNLIFPGDPQKFNLALPSEFTYLQRTNTYL